MNNGLIKSIISLANILSYHRKLTEGIQPVFRQPLIELITVDKEQIFKWCDTSSILKTATTVLTIF
jgi:hypothetical protein